MPKASEIAKSSATNNGQRILVVDDMEDARVSMQKVLHLHLKLAVEIAQDGNQALQKLEQAHYSVVVTDLRMPKMTGMQLIEEMRKRQISATIIVTTGHGQVADAVNAMRKGAYDFLTKPVDPQHLCLLVERALRERGLADEVAALRAQLGERFTFRNVISKSPRMVDVFELISRVAETAATVLIAGETGTGKEMIAEAVHDASAKHRSGPFVAINCAALPETLLESELFGHEKGSFTGAASQRKGRFEQAQGGTVFLDEVGDVPMSMQVKLLRVLQERRIERVGGGEPIDIDVRLVAATNRPLDKLVADGTFREDLFYRLNVVKIDLPALRDRTEDIPILAAHFAEKYARPNHPAMSISAKALDRLMAHSWPGNVRQLENAIERACITAQNGVIELADLPSDIAPRAAASNLAVDTRRPLTEQVEELTAAFEERYLRAALDKTHGHIGKCAELSGLSRRSITEKLAQYKIEKSEFKNGAGDED